MSCLEIKKVLGIVAIVIIIIGVVYFVLPKEKEITLNAVPIEGDAPLTVYFYCDENGTECKWDFGDGETANTGNEIWNDHTYTTQGTFTATVKYKTLDDQMVKGSVKIKVN